MHLSCAGIATVALAHLYPTAKIVVLEPAEDNCMVLKANTLTYANVHVECKGTLSQLQTEEHSNVCSDPTCT